MGSGTREDPWTNQEALQRMKTGEQAVRYIEKELGSPLSSSQKHILKFEAFVPGYYKDSIGLLTKGIGRTGEFLDKTFNETHAIKVAKAEQALGPLSNYPEDVQNEILQLTYRGDMKPDYDWVQDIKNNDFGSAAKNLLIHNEYLNFKKLGIKNSITDRLESAANTFKKYINGYAPGKTTQLFSTNYDPSNSEIFSLPENNYRDLMATEELPFDIDAIDSTRMARLLQEDTPSVTPEMYQSAIAINRIVTEKEYKALTQNSKNKEK